MYLHMKISAQTQQNLLKEKSEAMKNWLFITRWSEKFLGETIAAIVDYFNIWTSTNHVVY